MDESKNLYICTVLVQLACKYGTIQLQHIMYITSTHTSRWWLQPIPGGLMFGWWVGIAINDVLGKGCMETKKSQGEAAALRSNASSSCSCVEFFLVLRVWLVLVMFFDRSCRWNTVIMSHRYSLYVCWVWLIDRSMMNESITGIVAWMDEWRNNKETNVLFHWLISTHFLFRYS